MNDPYLLISTFPLFLNTLMKVLKNISSEVLFIYDTIIMITNADNIRPS